MADAAAAFALSHAVPSRLQFELAQGTQIVCSGLLPVLRVFLTTICERLCSVHPMNWGDVTDG